MGARKPIVGIPASVRRLEFGMLFHGTAWQYLQAVRDHVGATVVTIPGETADNAAELLEIVDGILLTGSFSNVHPSTYGEEVVDTSHGFFDEPRDAVTLPLIRGCLQRGVPIFGICRGMQEMNVALGGSLCQALHEQPGNEDHRPNETLPLSEQFRAAHEIEICADGVLAGLLQHRRIAVSTAHEQGIGRLAAGLRIEAVADDGVVEAVSVKNAASFAVGVQFHPEWDVAGNPLYGALFAEFRKAVCRRFAQRQGAVRAAADPDTLS
jgi:putative glutamine amidotransferase